MVRVVLLGAAGVYVVFFIAYSLQKHAAFQTAGFDLGNWDQIMWSALHGSPFWFTQYPYVSSALGDHVELILFVLFPLYGLHLGPDVFAAHASPPFRPPVPTPCGAKAA